MSRSQSDNILLVCNQAEETQRSSRCLVLNTSVNIVPGRSPQHNSSIISGHFKKPSA